MIFICGGGNMKILSLDGIFDMHSADGVFCTKAEIPGSDIGNLIKNGIIENPAEAPDGEKLACETARKSFIFERAFKVSESDLEYKNAALNFEKLDTLCEVFLNGKKVLSANNAHISYSVDVKNELTAGENKLKLIFASPLEYIEKKQRERAMPPNVNGVNGAMYLRKPNCAFGWDWGPCIPCNSIGSTSIRFFDREVKNITIGQKTQPSVSVIEVTAENADFCSLISPSGEVFEPQMCGGKFVFTVKDPELWYTRDLSEKETQPLYTVRVGNDEMTVEKKTGLRTVELIQNKDRYGENFMFSVNGKRVFAKGANVIPFAAIPEYGGKESVRYYTALAAKSNFNMLRVWGGGEYASEEFLDRCDELGILVWQDFCFACMMYPLDDRDFSENVRREAEFNIKRMAHRACLALFCGNNEIEEMNAAFVNLTGLRKAYVDYFYGILPETVKKFSAVPYIPTSPVGKAPFSHNSDESLGDSHMWAVWHGLMPSDWYSGRYARFLSEFGMESLPSLKAISTFAPGEKSVYSKPFLAHQKCRDGNRKLMYYLCERFSYDVDFSLLPYLTGILQADCIQAASEHFRRNKGRCNGSVFWQFNDVWNAPSWSAVDFEKVPKALMYKARRFFAPLALSYSAGALFLVNDTLTDKKISAVIRKYKNGHLRFETEKTFVSAGDSVMKICGIELFENELITAEINGTRYVFDNIPTLAHAEISAAVSGETVVLSSDTYAKNVCIECDGIPDDNYFSLMPGEVKTVKIDGGTGNLRVLCENNIDFKRSSLKKALFRTAYKLKPENFVSMLWHSLR